MRPKASFIAAFTVIAAAVSAWMLVTHLRPAPTPSIPASWVTLPETPPDARDARVRAALMAGLSLDAVQTRSEMNLDYREALALECGRDMQAGGERYRILIGDWSLAQPARVWLVDLVRRGESVDVVLHDESMPPPPPEDARASRMERRSPSIVTRSMSTRDLEPLRAALSSPLLWQTTDAIHGCMDGQPALVDACVEGRYYVSSKSCRADESVKQLWKTVTATFPPPPDWLH
jgi:hypothetical protein